MDRIVTYSYALGTGEQLRSGYLERIRTDLSRLIEILSKPREGLVVPEFIGVYQECEIMAHTNHQEELTALESAREKFESLKETMDILANESIASRFGIKDNTHPDLIFVAYNSEIWTPSLVRESLANKINRVVIAPYTELPNFYGKDTQIVQSIFDKGQVVFEREKDPRKSFEAIGPELKSFEEQITLYGMTRQEYVFLKLMPFGQL